MTAAGTSAYAGPNIDLQVREIIAAANGSGVDGILSTHNLTGSLDADAVIYFWREIERQFDIVVTRAQRQSLPTVGHVIHYLKVRRKMEAHGTL